MNGAGLGLLGPTFYLKQVGIRPAAARVALTLKPAPPTGATVIADASSVARTRRTALSSPPRRVSGEWTHVRGASQRQRRGCQGGALSFGVLVALAIVTTEEAVGGIVTDDSLFFAVPLDASTMLHREHAEKRHVRRKVDLADIADGL